MPYVIEPAAGVARTMMAFLIAAYNVDEVAGEERTVLRLHPRIAPYQVAVLPLSKKDTLLPLSQEVLKLLQPVAMCDYDITRAIGRRYRRQDEIGTPLCVTVDFDSLEDKAVTIRDRDSTAQERVPIDRLVEAVNFPPGLVSAGHGQVPQPALVFLLWVLSPRTSNGSESATDMVALVSEHVALRRVGRRWVGLCPFHAEKTGSFSVNGELGRYYCFGCQARGDAITFLRETEHLDFVTAVEALARPSRHPVCATTRPSIRPGQATSGPQSWARPLERAVEWYHELARASSRRGGRARLPEDAWL